MITANRVRLVKWSGWLVEAAIVVGCLLMIPHWWCSRDAAEWYAGEEASQLRLARGVERWVTQDMDRVDFKTGSSRFNGEWLFATYMMAGMGFGQTLNEHPACYERHLELMEACIDRCVSEKVRAFDAEAWGDDPLATLEGHKHHGAYLGYLNLLLSYHRYFVPESQYAELNDRITEALSQRLKQSRTLLVQTYPGETYPVDNCAVIASIGLHGRITGADCRSLTKAWASRLRSDYVDSESGLLYQAVDSDTGRPIDLPRGSGTALAVYFLSFVDPVLSRELFDASRRELPAQVLGFGAMREYPRSAGWRRGDIDSGPVIFGYGVSSTGFSLAGCRIHGDRRLFTKLYSTAHLFGGPVQRDDWRKHIMGGPIGDALLFAMLTAQPAPGSYQNELAVEAF